jgi:hypothetical protein
LEDNIKTDLEEIMYADVDCFHLAQDMLFDVLSEDCTEYMSFIRASQEGLVVCYLYSYLLVVAKSSTPQPFVSLSERSWGGGRCSFIRLSA